MCPPLTAALGSQGCFLSAPGHDGPRSRSVRRLHDGEELSLGRAVTRRFDLADPYHPALTAGRAAPLGPRHGLVLLYLRPPCLTGSAFLPHPQQDSATTQVLRPDAVAQQSVVADAHEPRGHDMQEEAADELHGVQSHDLLLVALRVVLP